MRAKDIRLPMPYEDDEPEHDEEWEDEDEWDDDEMPEPLSEDEQFAGVNTDPSKPPRRRKRRMPPMPRVPKPERDPDAWTPPFEVLEDGTVVGPTVGDADPNRLPEGFDPPKGTFEGVTSIFGPPRSR